MNCETYASSLRESAVAGSATPQMPKGSALWTECHGESKSSYPESRKEKADLPAGRQAAGEASTLARDGSLAQASASALLSTFSCSSCSVADSGARGVDSKPRPEDGLVLAFAWCIDGVVDTN